MYGSHFKLPSEGDVAPENGLRRSINTLSVFISPNSRGQTYVCQTQATTKETRGTSFDEIENLRTEVKRLSDIVSKQSDLISCIQKALSEKPNEDKSVDKLDLQTEFNQHKIALACLERDNMAIESMIKWLEGEVASLTVTVGHQCNKLLLLHNAVRDLYLGAGGEAQSERSSTSPQMRSVSCSELQANCVSHSVSEGNDQRGRVVRSYTSRLPPSGHQCQSRHNWKRLRQSSCPKKSDSSGKLNSLMVFLKSPKISLRQASLRSNKLRTNTYPLIEDEFSSEDVRTNHNARAPSLLLDPDRLLKNPPPSVSRPWAISHLLNRRMAVASSARRVMVRQSGLLTVEQSPPREAVIGVLSACP
ncbi:hypothetical protein EGR_02562 [Echinococcus granulosus]|uniref:Uncharacterized protein n=1 Tax=Echinococcus granulosus TaxID=6210 RepID=W6ULL2_ECHGR|nr:hypothetical protein EGR_02562 [Echinococcus granulosus]EUB62430.1 hypothetical protein EGR_02562 [Echinococcus granulosus]